MRLLEKILESQSQTAVPGRFWPNETYGLLSDPNAPRDAISAFVFNSYLLVRYKKNALWNCHRFASGSSGALNGLLEQS